MPPLMSNDVSLARPATNSLRAIDINRDASVMSGVIQSSGISKKAGVRGARVVMIADLFSGTTCLALSSKRL